MAAVTVVKDEAVMLPLWVHHYGERLGFDHLVVLDNESADGSTHDIAAEVRPLGELPGGKGFEKTRLEALNETASELLERFDWVVFTDADEFLVVDPERHDSFGDLLADCHRPGVAPLALNVVHDLQSEAALDTARPILDQRSFAQFTEVMCKPSSKRLPIRWGAASHAFHAEYEVRSDLFMLHLKFADLSTLRISAAHRRALHLHDGRGGGTWQIDDVAEQFETKMRNTDFSAAVEFDPSALDLDSLIVGPTPRTTWRTPKKGQLRTLSQQDVVRIPTRLRGSL